MRFFTPEILDNPYPLYEQWRAHHPIWQDEETGAWILSRFDDVRHVLKHSSDFSSKAMGGGETGPLPLLTDCLLYTSPSPRDKRQSRMPSSA